MVGILCLKVLMARTDAGGLIYRRKTRKVSFGLHSHKTVHAGDFMIKCCYDYNAIFLCIFRDYD